MLLEIKYWIASFFIWLSGWNEDKDHTEARNYAKEHKKIMIIGEPHTHILDFFIMLMMSWYFKFENLRFFITSKHMYPIISILFNMLGAISVDRKKNKNGLVDAIVEEINKREGISVQIGPSGTREKTDKWRSGFYHIALKSNIPILCSYVDCKTKTFGFAAPFRLTGDYKKDMDKIRDIYQNKHGLNPENVSLIRIKEEEENNKGETPENNLRQRTQNHKVN